MFFIFSAMIIWSSLGVIVRVTGASPYELILFPCIVSVCVTSLLFLRKQVRVHFPPLRKALVILLIAPLSLVNTFFFLYAYQKTTIANAVLTHYTAPIFVALSAPFFLREPLTKRIALSVGIATIGLWLMLGMTPADFGRLVSAGHDETLGIAAGLVSGMAYAALILILRVFSQKVHPLMITYLQNSAMGAMILPFSGMPDHPVPVLAVFVVLGVIHSTLAPVIYYRGLRQVSANKAAILGYIEPVASIAWGYIFLSEPVTAMTLAGGSLILISGYLTVRQAKDETEQKREPGKHHSM